MLDFRLRTGCKRREEMGIKVEPRVGILLRTLRCLSPACFISGFGILLLQWSLYSLTDPVLGKAVLLLAARRHVKSCKSVLLSAWFLARSPRLSCFYNTVYTCFWEILAALGCSWTWFFSYCLYRTWLWRGLSMWLSGGIAWFHHLQLST